MQDVTIQITYPEAEMQGVIKRTLMFLDVVAQTGNISLFLNQTDIYLKDWPSLQIETADNRIFTHLQKATVGGSKV